MQSYEVENTWNENKENNSYRGNAMVIIINDTKFSLFDYDSQPATIISHSEAIVVEEKGIGFLRFCEAPLVPFYVRLIYTKRYTTRILLRLQSQALQY